MREASLDQALASHPDPEGIPARNIQRMEKLGEVEVRALFPYLHPGRHPTD
ncbi:MAG: DUF1415 family protein [Stenotrophobium sp.]